MTVFTTNSTLYGNITFFGGGDEVVFDFDNIGDIAEVTGFVNWNFKTQISLEETFFDRLEEGKSVVLMQYELVYGKVEQGDDFDVTTGATSLSVERPEKHNLLGVGKIVGLIIGVAAIIIVVIGGVYFYNHNRQKQQGGFENINEETPINSILK
mmetsp:Transcript_35619/g.55579  ORF Transcript_35619/g.55579 Transcript_35619/m.55579 type:complete len:154 (+) Transcript_35619:1566-2027(+)|eukprot:CAMPEP_0201508242 /NCGR_PEP_ID=MMETSP0161_2-20130828/1657_1 /ASSEMBLY_ACC=CAM_ASM_000251 /TAXON_ID=180227 /ORGANISM="Neoparamoeba aestuarina, Strain SoJaBio B1-5/56/2" /LENGTH=153 /DNA_ID=CAMNT_0047902835 /DNA_START=1480 /DNA_END=1941 /DNA_ORIENTATION=-